MHLLNLFSKLFNLSHLLDKFSRQQIGDIFSIFVPENRVWRYIQIVFLGDNLHDMFFFSGENKRTISECRLAPENFTQHDKY